ncbi:MazE family transcriptional regulator [soil metagenome]
MHKTTLRKVGGSVMLAVPPALLAELGLTPGAKVDVSVAQGRLVVEKRRPRYALDDLLREHEALCARAARRAEAGDAALRGAEDERAWLDAPAAGREEI